PRRLRSEREVVQQQIVRMGCVDELAIIARQRFEAVIRGLDEDVRLVSRRSEHALDAEDFVADRVAVSQRRKNLVNANHARLRARDASVVSDAAADPRGSRASTSLAAATFCRRRSDQPGSGSTTAGGVARCRRSIMSRYFRSMTGQSYCSRKNWRPLRPSATASHRFRSIVESVSMNSAPLS